ncbi:HAD family hydrolase [Winogradskya consettensis]|uniref:Haloacid dehalogenase n=1 Tax=Winogradskya consettensis TaxID=113560 RepID=A0A919SE32_9ACTN|nr:HAD family hydrolase [Actinoplanes consettensis]GIM70146.1 haloacid dehalogenase [Actinoplanes consettensis]
MRTEVVVFDIDDTLYLERDYVASGFAAVEAELGIPGFASVAWDGFLRGRRGRIFDDALAELGVRADIGRMVWTYRNHQPHIAILPDALKALNDLDALGITTAFLTDGPVVSQAAKVRALGLSAFASSIVLTDALGPGCGKPSPQGFLRIAKETGASSLAYVADNPAKDFAGPGRLGWTTVRVRREGGLHYALTGDDDIDVTTPRLSNLTALLAGIPATTTATITNL